MGSRASAALIQNVLPAVNHHSELRAPITNVIVPHRIVAEELRDPGQSITEHGAADMTHVHRFGHVGRTEVDHNSTRRIVALATPSRSFCRSCPACRAIADRPKAKIDKAGAGNRGGFRPLAHIESRADFGGQFSRVFAALFRQNQRGIGLIIPEPRIGRRGELARVRQPERGERIREFSSEERLKGLHDFLGAPQLHTVDGGTAISARVPTLHTDETRIKLIGHLRGSHGADKKSPC